MHSGAGRTQSGCLCKSEGYWAFRGELPGARLMGVNMRGRTKGLMGAALGVGALTLAGSVPAHAAGAVTEGSQAYESGICYDDFLGNEICTMMEGRQLQVVLPNGRQLNRDKGTVVSEGYTWEGTHYTVESSYNSFTVYEEYTSPWDFDDQVTRVDTTRTTSDATGETCELTQTFVVVDGQERNRRTDVVCY